MNKETHVYGLSCSCHPERGIRYIGKTVQPGARRLRAHGQNAARGFDQPLYRWMRRHGIENIISTRLSTHSDTVSGSLAEIDAIQTHCTHVSAGGLNVTLGGDGGTGFKHSDETRAKMSAARAGQAQSAEHVAKRVKAMRDSGGYEAVGAAIAKRNRAQAGTKLSPQRRAALAKKLTPDQVQEIRELAAKRVMKQAEVGALYGVSRITVNRISRGITW